MVPPEMKHSACQRMRRSAPPIAKRKNHHCHSRDCRARGDPNQPTARTSTVTSEIFELEAPALLPHCRKQEPPTSSEIVAPEAFHKPTDSKDQHCHIRDLRDHGSLPHPHTCWTSSMPSQVILRPVSLAVVDPLHLCAISTRRPRALYGTMLP